MTNAPPDFQLCPDCGGSGAHLSMTVARIRKARLDFVLCQRCEDGIYPWNPGYENAEVRVHKPKGKFA